MKKVLIYIDIKKQEQGSKGLLIERGVNNYLIIE